MYKEASSWRLLLTTLLVDVSLYRERNVRSLLRRQNVKLNEDGVERLETDRYVQSRSAARWVLSGSTAGKSTSQVNIQVGKGRPTYHE